jgi:hypothetical protein
MAKKKKAKKTANKAAKKTVRSVPRKKKKPKPLPTDFLRKFDSSVITRDNPVKGKPRLWAWPPVGEPRPNSYKTMGDVINLLSTALETSTPPPPDPSSTFTAKVARFANTYPWPTSSRYAKYGKRKWPSAADVNRYEIAQVTDLMMQAIDGGGDGLEGGGGTRWPPVK